MDYFVFTGNPTTHIFARERTGAAVLEALKAGHVTISYAPAAERVDFTAVAMTNPIYVSFP